MRWRTQKTSKDYRTLFDGGITFFVEKTSKKFFYSILITIGIIYVILLAKCTCILIAQKYITR